VDDVRRITVSFWSGRSAVRNRAGLEGLALHPQHARSLTRVFAVEPLERATALYVPLVFDTDLENGAAIATALMGLANLAAAPRRPRPCSTRCSPASTQARRGAASASSLPTARTAISPTAATTRARVATTTVAAAACVLSKTSRTSRSLRPGFELRLLRHRGTDHAEAIARRMVTHCERMRYRVAVLDTATLRSERRA